MKKSMKLQLNSEVSAPTLITQHCKNAQVIHNKCSICSVYKILSYACVSLVDAH